VALSALNYVGVKAGSRVQTALTAAKLVAVLAIVIVGFALSPAAAEQGASSAGTEAAPFSAFLLAMVAGLFAYGGWHMVTYTAGETIVPTRTIPLALVSGVGIVTICYIALNFVYLSVLPVESVRSSTRIAADAADAVLGRGGSTIMAGLVMMSALGGLTGIVLTGPRVYYSMAQDGLAFRWLGVVHPVYRTPSNAIVAQGVWASVLAATGAYRELFTRVIYTEWLFFALMAAGLFVLRRRPGYDPRYRAWGYPVVPAIFIVASLTIVLNQLISDPKDASIGLGMVAIGAPIYYLWHAHHRFS
jgi:APA family basic amino acid/polyamine antiporter